MAATQISAKYTLTAPDGSVVTFNDQTDPNYVGMLTDVAGLDSPDIRESADDLVQQDGGIHGSFYYSRRPITLTGILLNPASATDRNTRQNKLSQASNAMRGDGRLSWTLEDGTAQQVGVRRQQPLRVNGTWQKTFQLGLVAADPRIYSAGLHTSTVVTAASPTTAGRAYSKTYNMAYASIAPLGQLLVTNLGNMLTYPVLRVYGPGNNPKIYNFTTGQVIALTYALGAGDWLTIDTLNRTVLLNDSASRYGAVDFFGTAWWGLVPGVNDLRIAYDTYIAGSSLRVDWRDAWL